LVAAGPLVPSWAWAQEALAEEAAAALPLSVGYLLGSADTKWARALAWRKLTGRAAVNEADAVVVPASSLPSGDPNFEVRGLRLWVNGLYPTRLRPEQMPRSIQLDQVTWTRDRAIGQRARFFAWSFRRDPAPQGSSPVRFNAAVGPRQPLELAMKVAPAQGGRAQRLRARFTLGMEGGVPRLERGVYFLAVFPEAFSRDVVLPRPDEAARPELLSLVVAVEPAQPG
jgi:hypothetical protein